MKKIICSVILILTLVSFSWAAVKLSQLPTVTSTTPANDYVPLIQPGVDSKITVANLLNGMTPAGSSGDIQWNNSSAFAGGGATWDNTAKTITTPQTTSPDELDLRTGSGAGTNFVGLRGPATNPSASYVLQESPTEPSAGATPYIVSDSSHVAVKGWIPATYSCNSGSACSTSYNVNPVNGKIQKLVLSGACAIGVTSLVAGQSFIIKLSQTASTQPTFTSAFKWPANTTPTFSTTTAFDTINCFSYDGTYLNCTASIGYTN